MSKSVSIVGTAGIPACYGGFESLVENLTTYKRDRIEYTVYCSSKHYKERKQEHNSARLVYLPVNANGIQSITYDILSLVHCLFSKPDTVVILGVSGCIFLPIFKVFSQANVVTNIDGLEWKRAKWNILGRKFLKFSEYMAVKFSDIIVTDNQAITEYVAQEYSKLSETIAYGGDHAIRDIVIDDANYDEYALALCRIEPENNVDMILEAYSKAGKRIKFIGNWKSSQYGIDVRNKYDQFKNIELIDPIYDIDVLYLIRSKCSLYIHGHSAGGTNPSLVEMMHFSVPIFAFDCSFNRFSTENKAMYFGDSSELQNLIEQGLSDDCSMAKEMKEIAQRKYTWEIITQMYENLY